MRMTGFTATDRRPFIIIYDYEYCNNLIVYKCILVINTLFVFSDPPISKVVLVGVKSDRQRYRSR